MLHARTAFAGHPDPARTRHLRRLGLMQDGRRPLVGAVHAHEGIAGRGQRSTHCTDAAMPGRH